MPVDSDVSIPDCPLRLDWGPGYICAYISKPDFFPVLLEMAYVVFTPCLTTIMKQALALGMWLWYEL